MTAPMSGVQFSLGKLIAADDKPERDAIHIAVAPVVAAQNLLPGQHVGFDGKGADTVDAVGTFIGVVDPFLKAPVNIGERFWLFLYPNTITALRHEWTHPSFEAAGAADVVSRSRAWITDFAAELDQTYNRLMSAAEMWVRDEDYTYDNSETYKDVDYAKWPIFWSHYEIVTGAKVKDHDATFFTCSC